MTMYNVPTNNCNIEIMGYPFFAEKVSPNESFNRRDMVVNNLVGGTAIVTKGAYIPLDFTITTHVFVNEDRPDEHNAIFKEMMSKPVEVISPEIGGMFMAVVTIKPEHTKNNSLELSITIKEVPELTSNIPGESWVVPAPKDVEVKGKNSDSSSTTTTTTTTTSTNASSITLDALRSKLQGSSGFANVSSEATGSSEKLKEYASKINSIAKKNKGEA